MKFFAILFLLCGIVGFVVAASSTTTTEVSYDTTTAPSATAPPCASGPKPQGPCGQAPPVNPCAGGSQLCAKKLYFFY
ncbi:hypothetical protein KR084_007116 [Drosophila pseudotakahashii]|nr:hypothetical protein KR084_007116 [Drosophila pseudotakahashii]